VFNLRDPIHVIHLYVFCSKLERYFTDQLAKDLQEWKGDEHTTEKIRLWRSPSQVAKRCWTDLGNSSGWNDSGGGGGAAESVDELEEYDDDYALGLSL